MTPFVREFFWYLLAMAVSIATIWFLCSKGGGV
jgi:hypothetical protein